jgi:hypothetical protein
MISSASVLFSDNFENGDSNWSVKKGIWYLTMDSSSKVYFQPLKVEGRTSSGSLPYMNYSVKADVNVVDFNGRFFAQMIFLIAHLKGQKDKR